MKYLLMICVENPDAVPEDAMVVGCGGWTEEMQRRGVIRGSAGLRPPSDATTVRVRDGELLLTDGPYAETKELMGGFTLIECADLDEAIEIAAKHPSAQYGMIEVRPVWER